MTCNQYTATYDEAVKDFHITCEIMNDHDSIMVNSKQILVARLATPEKPYVVKISDKKYAFLIYPDNCNIEKYYEACLKKIRSKCGIKNE